MAKHGVETPHEPARSPHASRRVWAIAVLMAALALALAGLGGKGPEIASDGDLEGLVPSVHRSLRGEHRVLLWISDPRGAAASEDLLAAADLVRERLGAAFRPLAAPANEVAGWIDRHALLMMPAASHGELRTRLADAAIDDAVAALRSRMSSPFFGVMAADERRDPLHLRDLADAGTRGLAAAAVLPSGARATTHGDLLAQDGQSLLMATRDDADEILESLRGPLRERGIAIAIVGPRRTEIELVRGLRAQLGPTGWQWLAATMIVLALAFRRVMPALLGVVAIAIATTTVAWVSAPLGLWTTPLPILLGGFAWLVDPRASASREPSTWTERLSIVPTLVVAMAVLPLGLGPYPAWRWAVWAWPLGIAIAAGLLALAGLVGRPWGSARPIAAVVRPWLAWGIVVLAFAVGLGVLVRVPVRALYEAGPGLRFEAPEQALLEREFFDPYAILHIDARGPDPEHVLGMESERDDVQRARERVPTLAVVEGPRALAVSPRELAERRQSLAELELSGRVRKLELSLEAHGFRAGAFGEFLRSAADPEAMPTATAMLASPLRPWIDRYLEIGEGLATVRTDIHMERDADVDVLLGSGGTWPIPVLGPPVARQIDRASVRHWLVIFALAQIWLGAFVVWLARDFAVAMAAASVAAVTEVVTLASVAALGVPLSATLAPAIVLVGASAIVRVDRACDAKRPQTSRELLLVALGPAAAGLTLVAAQVDPWFELGLTAAVGSVLAAMIGTGLGRGLVAGFQRVSAGPRPRVTANDREPEIATPRASRRSFAAAIGLACMLPRRLRAEPAANDKRVQNRVELWANYARHTSTLIARVTTERESALASEPWITTGTLWVLAPDRLLLRDDGPLGSTTWIDRDVVHVMSHVAGQRSERPIALADDPAARWLAERLLRVFLHGPSGPERAGTGESLLDDTRSLVPPGSGYRLELAPPRGSIVRKSMRSLTLHFDPVAGAVTQILLTEAQGDTLRLRLTDHRQNVDPTELETAFTDARALLEARQQAGA